MLYSVVIVIEEILMFLQLVSRRETTHCDCTHARTPSLTDIEELLMFLQLVSEGNDAL